MALSDDLHEFFSREDERVGRVLLRRFCWHIFDRRNGAYRALRAAPGTNVANAHDPRCKSYEQELREAGYTEVEITEKAIREVVENELAEVYHHGFGPDTEDFTPYLAEVDKDELVMVLVDFYEDALHLFEFQSSVAANGN